MNPYAEKTMNFSNKFLNLMIILWLLSLITLGVVSNYVERDIQEQRANRR